MRLFVQKFPLLRRRPRSVPLMRKNPANDQSLMFKNALVDLTQFVHPSVGQAAVLKVRVAQNAVLQAVGTCLRLRNPQLRHPGVCTLPVISPYKNTRTFLTVRLRLRGTRSTPEFVRPQSFRHSNAQGLFEPAQRDATWHPIMENYCPTVTVA